MIKIIINESIYFYDRIRLNFWFDDNDRIKKIGQKILKWINIFEIIWMIEPTNLTRYVGKYARAYVMNSEQCRLEKFACLHRRVKDELKQF